MEKAIIVFLLFLLLPGSSLSAHQSGHGQHKGNSGVPPMAGGSWMKLSGKSAAGQEGKSGAVSSCGSASLEDGWLGVAFSGAAKSGKGLVIKSVIPGSEAEKAGLRSGDILVGVNGNQISNLGEVENIVASLPLGSKARILYQRAGQEKKTEITVAKRQLFMQGQGMMMMGGMRPMFNGRPMQPGMFRESMMKQSPVSTMNSGSQGAFSRPPVMMGNHGSRIDPPMIPLESGRLSDSPAVGGRVRLNKIDRILEARNDLNLMGAQISQLKTIKRDLRKQNIRLEAEIKIAEIELEELLGQSDVDIKAVEKKIREVEEAKTKKTIGSIKAEKRAKDILTERQKKIFSID